MPTDERDQLRAWSQAITLTLEPLITAEERQAATDAAGHMREFVEAVIAERRKAPRENDLLSALIAAEEEGERLSTSELVSMVLLLFVAGHETTVNLIGNGTRLLMEHPDVLARFRADPSVDATAVDELLRMDGPVQFTARAGARAGRLRRRRRREGSGGDASAGRREPRPDALRRSGRAC